MTLRVSKHQNMDTSWAGQNKVIQSQNSDSIFIIIIIIVTLFYFYF